MLKKQLMPPSKGVKPYFINLEASGVGAVLGCPGVLRTIPRIETSIELRPVNGNPFFLRSVGVELRASQNIIVPSKLGSNEIYREYKIYENGLVFTPAMGEFSERVLGADIPIIIPISKDIMPGGSFAQWNAFNCHFLVVRVCCGESYETEESFIDVFPVAIRQYDSLPLYRKFNEPISEVMYTKSNQVMITITVPTSAFGPGDLINATVKASINTRTNKTKKNLKLRYFSMQLREILEIHESGVAQKKINKLAGITKSFKEDESLLTSIATTSEFQLTVPFDDNELSSYSGQKYSNSSLRDSSFIDLSVVQDTDKDYPQMIEGIPLTNTKGFSFEGELFSISYELGFKFKLNSGKEIETTIPITISPFNKASCSKILSWIMEECEDSKIRFGKPLLDQTKILRFEELDSILRRYIPPPTLYKYSKNSLQRFGFKVDDLTNSVEKVISYYID